jgi:cell division protein ZapA
MIADELSDAGLRIRRLEEELAAMQDARIGAVDRNKVTQAAIAAAFNSAADRIERLTQTLNRRVGNGVAIG